MSEEFSTSIGDLGFKPDEFWKLTYAEYVLIIEGYNRKERNKINNIITQAWYNEYINIQVRNTGELPKLADFLINIDGEKPIKKEQTGEEMMQKARLLNAALGGIEIIN